MLLVALGPADHVSNSSSVGRFSGPRGIPVPALRLRQYLFRTAWPQPVRTSQTSRTLLRTSQTLDAHCGAHSWTSLQSGTERKWHGCSQLEEDVWSVHIALLC